MGSQLAQRHPGVVIASSHRHGVVSRAQLVEAGLTKREIQTAVATGRLHRVHRGVYAVGRREFDGCGLYLAAVLALGPGAALSHRAAAAHHGLRPSSSRQAEVTAPSRNGRARRPGITVHRCAIHSWEYSMHDGIPTTTVARTLLDLAETLAPDALRRAIDASVQRQLFDLTPVERVLAAHPHRVGAARLRRALAAEAVQTNEGLETAFLDFLRARNFPMPEIKPRVGPYEPDFYWREQRVIVETDDWDSHAPRPAFEHDRERSAWFGARRHAIVPVTWRRLHGSPDGIATDLRDALGI